MQQARRSIPSHNRWDELAASERFVPESGSSGRTPFQRDRARVLHSSALRRLAGTTQVVCAGEDDFPRTRLTHTLECAQIGRELGGVLGCEPDLVDAACLAHDLGHPPFGHNGEIALDEVGQACGGFEGNAQSFRILTRLEAKVLDDGGRSAGLNLTRAALDGTLKYPWLRTAPGTKFGVYAEDQHAFEWVRRNAATPGPSLEARVMDWADDVAYSVHDLEDGVQARHVSLPDLARRSERAALVEAAAEHYSELTPSMLREAAEGLFALPLWPQSYDGGVHSQVALKSLTSELIGRFCGAAVTASLAADDAERAPGGRVELVVPDVTRAECSLLKAVTARYVMARPGAATRQQRERELITELVDALADRAPGCLEPALRDSWGRADDDGSRMRIVLDQVARLTDGSARAWHQRLCRRRS